MDEGGCGCLLRCAKKSHQCRATLHLRAISHIRSNGLCEIEHLRQVSDELVGIIPASVYIMRTTNEIPSKLAYVKNVYLGSKGSLRSPRGANQRRLSHNFNCLDCVDYRLKQAYKNVSINPYICLRAEYYPICRLILTLLGSCLLRDYWACNALIGRVRRSDVAKMRGYGASLALVWIVKPPRHH